MLNFRKLVLSKIKMQNKTNTANIKKIVIGIQGGSGIVRETIDALSTYNCKIISEFEIIINHCLLGVRGTKIAKIKTIMSHSQALAQCWETENKMM